MRTPERINVAPLGTVRQPGVFQVCVSGASTWAPAASYLAECISRRSGFMLLFNEDTLAEGNIVRCNQCGRMRHGCRKRKKVVSRVWRQPSDRGGIRRRGSTVMCSVDQGYCSQSAYDQVMCTLGWTSGNSIDPTAQLWDQIDRTIHLTPAMMTAMTPQNG
jgi:hypothetical protein